MVDAGPAEETLLTAVRRSWAAAAGASGGASAERGLRVTPAPGGSTAPPGWCCALAIGAAVLVTAPDGVAARALQRALDASGLHDAEQLRAAVLAGTLPGVQQVLGPASLSYRAPGGSGTATPEPPSPSPSSPSSWVVEEVDDAGGTVWREQLTSTCSPAEVAESLLDELEHVRVVREDGAVVAAAGWKDWPGGVAHVGVLAAPAARGRGAATAVARATVDAAARTGSLVQWRAAPEPSRRLARRAGLVDVGWQLSWRWAS